MMMELFQVDAFTDQPFGGNPAAVCLLPHPRDDSWMQQVAAEMNLSETAFVWTVEDGFSLRWFTPTVEVQLCGHATLATAHVLWESGRLKTGEGARFMTRSGLLTAEHHREGIELDFPALAEEPASAPPGLIAAQGVPPKYVGMSGENYLIEVEGDETLRQMTPDFSALRTQPGQAVMVTSLAAPSAYDFVSRFFAPRVGIDEDPVTGSAHCALGPFWARRLGKEELVAYQASRRGGIVRISLRGNRVRLTGRAITVLRGELLV